MPRSLLSLAFLFFLLPLAPSSAEPEPGLADRESLTLLVNVSGKVTLSDEAELVVNLSLFPFEDDRQTMLSFKPVSSPEATIEEKAAGILYTWQSVSGEVAFGWTATVRTKVDLPSSSKVAFPPKKVDYAEFSEPSEFIDSDESTIVKKANEIVSGYTDSLKALHALAAFVKETVTYDEGLTGVTKKASWVLANKRGVCSEFAALFAALARAVNFPVSYVSGIAYSSEKEAFGSHAWSSVFLPTHGWLSFDPTYGQFGWLDVTHVALARTVDIESAVTYSYKSVRPVELEVEELEITASVIEKGQPLSKKSKLTLDLLADKVADGSYVPVKVKAENEQLTYLPLELVLTKAPGLYEGNVRRLLLAPGEARSAFFILELPTKPAGYVYEAPIEIETQFGNVITGTISFSPAYERKVSLGEAKAMVEELEEVREFTYNAGLTCKAARTEFYPDETVTVNCEARNKGNIFLENLRLCVAGTCSTFDLPIGASKNVTLRLPERKESYLATLTNELVSEKTYVSVNLLPFPSLEIVELKPGKVNFAGDTLSVTIKTDSRCENLTLSVDRAVLEVDFVEGEQTFLAPFAGSLSSLSKKLTVKAACLDRRGRRESDEKTFTVEFYNVPWYFKFLFFLYSLLGV